MSAIDVLIARLAGVRSRGVDAWIARCPAHKDRRPSLSIKLEPDGRILIHCFAECEVSAIVEALGLTLADLMPPRALDHVRPREGAHAHAARDAMRVMAREAWIVVRAAEDIAAGAILSPKDRARTLEAALRIRGAANLL